MATFGSTSYGGAAATAPTLLDAVKAAHAWIEKIPASTGADALRKLLADASQGVRKEHPQLLLLYLGGDGDKHREATVLSGKEREVLAALQVVSPNQWETWSCLEISRLAKQNDALIVCGDPGACLPWQVLALAKILPMLAVVGSSSDDPRDFGQVWKPQLDLAGLAKALQSDELGKAIRELAVVNKLSMLYAQGQQVREQVKLQTDRYQKTVENPRLSRLAKTYGASGRIGKTDYVIEYESLKREIEETISRLKEALSSGVAEGGYSGQAKDTRRISAIVNRLTSDSLQEFEQQTRAERRFAAVRGRLIKGFQDIRYLFQLNSQTKQEIRKALAQGLASDCSKDQTEATTSLLSLIEGVKTANFEFPHFASALACIQHSKPETDKFNGTVAKECLSEDALPLIAEEPFVRHGWGHKVRSARMVASGFQSFIGVFLGATVILTILHPPQTDSGVSQGRQSGDVHASKPLTAQVVRSEVMVWAALIALLLTIVYLIVAFLTEADEIQERKEDLLLRIQDKVRTQLLPVLNDVNTRKREFWKEYLEGVRRHLLDSLAIAFAGIETEAESQHAGFMASRASASGMAAATFYGAGDERSQKEESDIAAIRRRLEEDIVQILNAVQTESG